MASSDVAYLKGTVGAVLAKGVAETLAASPADPVQFLGEWLHRHVSNISIEMQHVMGKKIQVIADEASKQDLIAAQRSGQAVVDAKQAAIKEVRSSFYTKLLLFMISVVTVACALAKGQRFRAPLCPGMSLSTHCRAAWRTCCHWMVMK
jgi:hypothetical protein